MSRFSEKFHLSGKRVAGVQLLIALLVLGLAFVPAGPASAQGDLSVQIISGYNLVVDSNVTSPSTYAPSVATVIGRVCNESTTATLTNVEAFIGDSGAGTPGLYPVKDSAGFDASHPLYNTGLYAYQHVGGRLGTGDATRLVGDLAPGECRVQYWHFKYPQCQNQGGAWEDPPCTGTPAWGTSVKPDDDLSLDFDIWATADGGHSASASKTMTMRNEISAMANKIQPNPDGEWFNTNSNVVLPGDTITSNGVWYELGNVRFGFDNDNDLFPDYNAWLQPVGDPSYDPSCFRLIHTEGELYVTMGGSQMTIPFDDRNDPDPTYGGPLYFTDLPENNTGVRGVVYYTFLALDGPCSTGMTPYQEVASGFDNEKFNGDFGTGLPPLGSSEPEVTIDKASNPNTVDLGQTFTYNVPLANTSPTTGAGLPLSTGGLPLVISDTVPSGLEYIGASASADVAVSIRYSVDSGQTWSATDPGTTLSTGPNNLVVIQWWLDDTLPASSTATGTFQARAPAGATPPAYSGDPFVENCADVSFGAAAPFGQACAITMIRGNNSVGTYVWRDENNDGAQDEGAAAGINGVEVRLYFDKNGDGLLDDGDVLIATQDTSGVNDANYTFSELPDGNYLVEVDTDPERLPTGYRITTPQVYAVNLDADGDVTTPVFYADADFGFGPALSLDKELSSENPSYEGDLVVYTIDLANNRPGDGGGQEQACTYTTWASALEASYNGTGQKVWTNPGNLPGSPDAVYATAPFNNAGEFAGVNGWDIGTQTGSPTSVKVVMPIQVSGVFDYRETLQVNIVDCGVNGICEGDAQGDPGGDDVVLATRTINADSLTTGNLEIDVTADHAWTWAHFAGSNTVVEMITHNHGNNTGLVLVDAVSFAVSNGLTCNDPADTIKPLPLTDTYDPTKLELVSADPPYDFVDSGTIYWNDLGPLYPGQTKTVTVNFRALEPPGNATTSHQNCAYSGADRGAEFLDGSDTNDPVQDCVTHNIEPTGSIGDFVWSDVNSDGQQTGESGIPGVTLHLCTSPAAPCDPSSANYIKSTVTDGSGYYLFDALRDGDYIVSVDTSTLPGTYGTSTVQTGDPDEPGVPCTTCDNTTTNPVTISGANDVDTVDFGYNMLNVIFGNVWEDNDASTTKDAGENGFDSVTVYLCTTGTTPCNSSTAYAQTQTNSNGDYRFSDLPDGSYYVAVDTSTLPPGATWTNTVDPEGAPGDDESNAIAVAGGNVYGSYNFGYHRSGAFTLGDTVYVDWNGNGQQDSGEEGIENVPVYLYQDDNGDGVIDPDTDPLLAQTSTGGSGDYLFTDLPAQSYLVVVDNSDLPSYYNQTQDPDEDPGVCTVCDSRGQATLGPNDDTVDFGYQPIGAGEIGDFVWRDDDGDGIQDEGEPGIAGIRVTLYEDSNGNEVIDAGDAVVDWADTRSDGTYLFTGLAAGSYLVDVDTSDTDLPTDGNGDPYILSTDNDPHPVELEPGQAYLDADFGFTTGGIIGDYVWQDNNGDGQGTWEPGVNGVTITLYDCGADGICENGDDQVVGTTTTATDPSTGKDGFYEFTGLAADDYYVVVDATNFGSGGALEGWTLTYDPDAYSTDRANYPFPPCDPGDPTHYVSCDSRSVLQNAATVNNPDPGPGLPAGQIDRSHDFGYQPPGVLGETLWINSDGDGTRDPDEAGIPYITVWLYTPGPDGECDGGGDDDVYVGETETDSDGYYYFGNLNDGTYCVVANEGDEDFPAGLAQNYDPDGTNDGQTEVVISGGSVTSVGGSACTGCEFEANMGYQYSGPYDLSGYVYYDPDESGGLYDPTTGDLPYDSVTVYLFDSTGQVISETVTNAGGFYIFPNLPNGIYAVAVKQSDPPLDGTTIQTEPTPDPYRRPVTIADADVVHEDFAFFGGEAPPTAVTLASFFAVADGSQILLTWETVSEIDTLGFNLYRAESPDGPWTRINSALIDSQTLGSPVGSAYSFADANVVGGTIYYYRLEALDINQAASLFGPVSAIVTPSAPGATFQVFLPLVNK